MMRTLSIKSLNGIGSSKQTVLKSAKQTQHYVTLIRFHRFEPHAQNHSQRLASLIVHYFLLRLS
jgi:hypothetical protein